MTRKACGCRQLNVAAAKAGSMAVLAVGLGIAGPTWGQDAGPAAAASMVAGAPAAPRVDLVICLDTSGSMEGLINAARTKLWAIVNDLALAKPTPRLRVALLTYGNDGHLAEDGWVLVDSGFTDDLDRISQQLFALTTNGGTEYVGRVLHRALGSLDWDVSADSLRLVVVAGNESADQDAEFNFRDACRELIAKGIMVNSIYCGNPADELAPAWREVATLADGQFAAIDHDNGTVAISTPMDDQLATLSASVNATYIPLGELGLAAASNQMRQDANAMELSGAAAAQRAMTKSSAMYNCSWDLIDACRLNQVKLGEVKEEELPENMRAMKPEERQKYVDDLAKKRADIQNQIATINKQREVFVTQEMARLAVSEDKSFDFAIRQAIRAQACKKGFTFVEPEPAAAEAPVTPEEATSPSNGGQGG